MIHLHHRSESPKPSFDDVLGGAFEIGKLVLCMSVNGGNFTLISVNEYVRKNQNLSWKSFHGTPFRERNFNGTRVQ